MMRVNEIYNEDCMETLRRMPDGFFNCCVTSPPYYGLRDYGHDGQVGLEETPDAYVRKLVDIFRLVRDKMKDDGTLWLNLGDSYNSSPAGNKTPSGFSQTRPSRKEHNVGMGLPNKKCDGLKPKDLIGIPWMVAFALQADGWYLRQDIIWHKPNPMPESVTDRCTKSHEYIFLLSKKQNYYYDAEAIKDPYTKPMNRWGGQKLKANGTSTWDDGTGQETYRDRDMRPDENGRNKRSVWTVNTKPYKEAHFATFPEKLIEPCILAGCPEKGIVYDPFMGAATTALVALRADRKFVGSEINPEYVKIGNKRIKMLLTQYSLDFK